MKKVLIGLIVAALVVAGIGAASASVRMTHYHESFKTAFIRVFTGE